METLKLNLSRTLGFISPAEISALKPEMERYNRMLHDKTGKGNDFLGWVGLPSSITASQVEEIQDAAHGLASLAEVVVVIGIGGSYLGAKSVIEALSDSFEMLKAQRTAPLVLFAGQNLSEDYMCELLDVLKNRSIAVVVISKSGTTTEPAIAFRIFKAEIEARYGKAEAAKRIVAVTDANRGALRTLATQEGYKTFVIPDDVGGRFSVLTPVGLLPLAAAGIDIRDLVRGAVDMEKATCPDAPFEANPAMQYAAARNALYRKGRKVEILASYEPKLQYIAEWWKQLYGESEGKEGKGIFPASVTLTADLHSMGQYIQEGERMLFETVIHVEKSSHSVMVEPDPANLDGLNFLVGKSLTEINHKAEEGTAMAHVDGGVPNLRIELPRIDAYTIGALLYFFENACGISGYALGVNPFDQPGVEAYKKNMFALLGKPGY
ncbi:MAG: glucose-6-phosphate isomerase [Rikenellaceae bacterium]|jgi:glucose-6-phosphate isomerase|nr:glucose-6-phosphate isomerase [Rikenellaceae bacterium]